MTLRLLVVTGAGDLPVAGGHVDGARVAVVSTAVPEDRSLDYCSNFIIIYTQLNCTTSATQGPGFHCSMLYLTPLADAQTLQSSQKLPDVHQSLTVSPGSPERNVDHCNLVDVLVVFT